jgi:hypothetical protein
MGATVARKPETFSDEMKRYVAFTENAPCLLPALGLRVEALLPVIAEPFYAPTLQRPDAYLEKPLPDLQAPIDRLRELVAPEE